VSPVLLGDLAGPDADVVVLIKPQFEAGRAAVTAGKGVIRDPAVWLDVLTDVTATLSGHGAAIMGVMVSPISGADGNVEFLAHLRAHRPNATNVDLPAVIDQANQVNQATGRSQP
jgi:23S rRNA (cytidine1920-2'-O)/16S rRNA (cytidine1409-2'-O)-methyltransferase